MPKNAVQRLQKIDKDIKTVLSIYDIAKNSSDKDGASKEQTEREGLQFSKINTSKCWENTLLLDKLREQSTQPPSLLSEPFKQIGTYIPQLEHCAHSDSVIKRYSKLKKPNSAPPSSSALSTICESDYKWQQASDSVNGSAAWVESYGFSKNYDPFMSPSKTLLTANEILTNNNYPIGEKSTVKNEELVLLRLAPSASKGAVNCRTKEDKGTVTVKAHPSHKPREREHDFNSPVKTLASKTCQNGQKNETLPDLSPVIPKKVQRLEKSGNVESKVRTRYRSKLQESTEKLEKGWSIGKFEGLCAGRGSEGKYSGSTLGAKQKNSAVARHEKKNKTTSEKERKIPISRTFKSQNTHKSPETNHPELQTNELSKIIERSNEKLEKMKLSKDLALDIAKQLKDKYDKIQHSKEELMGKLQNSEKDNKRLSNEVKNAQEGKMKLQLKIEGLKKNSRTKLLEQEVKTKEILEENAWLKAKMIELEKDQSEQLLEKQTEIQQLRKQRLLEIKSELKNRENRAGDVQRLTNDKLQLSAKIEELRTELKERQAMAESQEDKICQLQEEIQKQKQHLKEKTETLEETNKELETIRENSNGLESQVKTLRKNIDNFDNMHKNLMKDHEQQIKSSQEQIQKLHDENLRLTTELENEKDALRIKTKIIEDQQETIRQLRERADEAKTLLKRNQSLERVLYLERDEKLELQEAVERLKWRKEELKSKIKALESDLLLAPQEVVKDLQKTQMVLHELENQVQIKQKEWEVHLQTLIREKERACRVAEFATKRLMQTTTEFQKQSEAHKRLHWVLAENLAEKERHLREVNEKVQETDHSTVHKFLKPIMQEVKFSLDSTGSCEGFPHHIILKNLQY